MRNADLVVAEVVQRLYAFRGHAAEDADLIFFRTVMNIALGCTHDMPRRDLQLLTELASAAPELTVPQCARLENAVRAMFTKDS